MNELLDLGKIHSRPLYGIYTRLFSLQMEFASVSDRESKRRALSDLRREFSGRERSLDRVGEASLHLVQRGELSDAERLEEMAQEFSDLRGEVAARYEGREIFALTANSLLW